MNKLAGPTIDERENKGGVPVVSTKAGPLFRLEDIVVKVVDEINKMPQDLTPLARATIDARTCLTEAAAGLGGIMDDFRAQIKVALEDIRQTRMATVTEVAKISAPLKDIRQFFIGNDYQLQIERLREFVDLCERLKSLKDAGFLDAISDTLLKLACRE